MRAIIKGRWLITILWIVFAAVLLITAPNMAQLTKKKGKSLYQTAIRLHMPISY